MSGPRVTDALGRTVSLAAPARRVVSLVPSETESVATLAGVDVLVGRTEWCEEPAGRIETVPVVGGTKKFDVSSVQALAPDLVLANKEENGRALVQQLIDDGLPVYVSFPRTVLDAMAYLTHLAALLGIDAESCSSVVAGVERAVARARDGVAHGSSHQVFVPIWKDPWMTFDGRAFASDLLELCGGINVFLDRPRRYPLAADLGRRAALEPARVGDRDTRYPRVTLEEVQARAPDIVLLPDEPYEFTEQDAAIFRALEIPAARRDAVVQVSGKDLFWYGTRLASSLDRVRAMLAAQSAGC